MNEGVEWALHSCLNLAWMEGKAVTATRLAAHYDLPSAYLNKQLQTLVKAGILTSTSGPKGGFRLAREPGEISVLDVVVALEGAEDAFRCEQVLRDAPGGRADVDYRKACLISQTMRSAELAWRRELAARTIADLRRDVEQRHPGAGERTRTALTTPKS
ncbi:Rrf2 family transcriptional regulator [Nonomuraea sp. NBC_01738]|uniref:RrF2 family transcriptional regulator n=1 Tax=Nonomuraea sp. NBC_01738 TaxID=2976003 RepID=UPI002E123608|nr:Rrf2 family transcriptional regulator [Nonomuraea sp. NBC_01738]